MNATSGWGRSRSRTQGRAARAYGLVVGFVALSLGPDVSSASPQEMTPPTNQQSAAQPVAAVWQERSVVFTFNSTSTVYSCDALESRVRSVLVAIGAREDLKMRSNNCSESYIPADDLKYSAGGWNTSGTRATSTVPPHNTVPPHHTVPHSSPAVFVKLRVPVEVTPEVLAELDKDKSRRELVSRVTGDPAERFNDPVVFQAQRQTVTLSRKTIGIEPEECELLDQFSRTMFRPLGVRVITQAPACDPSYDSHLPPDMKVEALMPMRFDHSAPLPEPPPVEEESRSNETESSGGAAPQPVADPAVK